MMKLVVRRELIAGGAALAALSGMAAPRTEAFAELEKKIGGRIGVHAYNPATGRTLSRRADERFPMCSTFKVLLAGAILARVQAGQERLDRRIAYGQADMVSHAPVTAAHLAEGALPVERLCQAVVEVSDNPAANLLLKSMGGPEAFTAFLRRLGDETTRLDRYELELNIWTPGEERDTTTPRAMARTLHALLTGPTLSQENRARLAGWMIDSPTGRQRLRARLPAGWRAGDKTGTFTGDLPSCNDVAVFWPPSGPAIYVAAYLSGFKATLAEAEQALAEIGAQVARDVA